MAALRRGDSPCNESNYDADCQHTDASNKAEEVAVIAFSDAIVHERAVVVVYLHTVVAVRAV